MFEWGCFVGELRRTLVPLVAERMIPWLPLQLVREEEGLP